MPAAGGDADGFAFQVAHLGEIDDAVAGVMDDFQSVANPESVLHVDLGDAVRAADDVADVLLARAFGVALHIVLVLVGVVAFEEAVGVTAACQRIQRA